MIPPPLPPLAWNWNLNCNGYYGWLPTGICTYNNTCPMTTMRTTPIWTIGFGRGQEQDSRLRAEVYPRRLIHSIIKICPTQQRFWW
jgi:hypothetical protein